MQEVKIEMPEFSLSLAPFKKYQAFIIKSDPDAQFCAQKRIELKNHIKATEDQRKEYTGPLDVLKAKMIEDERKITDPLKLIVKALDDKLIEWSESQEEIRRTEAERQRQVQLEAFEAEKQRQLAIAAENDDEKAAEAVAEIDKNVERLAASPVVVQNTVRTQTGHFAIQTRWRAQVVDESKVPREFLIVDEKKLQKYATAMKETAKVDGVQFYAEKGGMSRG